MFHESAVEVRIPFGEYAKFKSIAVGAKLTIKDLDAREKVGYRLANPGYRTVSIISKRGDYSTVNQVRLAKLFQSLHYQWWHLTAQEAAEFQHCWEGSTPAPVEAPAISEQTTVEDLVKYFDANLGQWAAVQREMKLLHEKSEPQVEPEQAQVEMPPAVVPSPVLEQAMELLESLDEIDELLSK